MKMLVESFLDIVLISLIVLLGSQFIALNLSIQNARTYHLDMIEQIESSNMNQDVITSCKNQAAAKYGTGALTVTNCTTYDERESYYVKLKYTIKMPFTGTQRTYCAEGYAR